MEEASRLEIRTSKNGRNMAIRHLQNCMDISNLVRAKRWCRYAAWMAYVWALLIGFLVFFGGAWPLIVALALAALGYSVQEGSRLGAIVLAILFLAFQAFPGFAGGSSLFWYRLLSAVAGSILVLAGLAAAFSWQRLSRQHRVRERTGFFKRLRHFFARFRSKHVWRAAALVITVIFCLVAMVAAALIIGSTGLAGAFDWFDQLLRLLVLILIIVVCSKAMAYCWRTAKRYSALQASQMRECDERPPVLLLRSFGDDLTSIARRPTLNTSLAFYDSNTATLEEVIENALWFLGPVVAIGRPGEKLPPAGAAREYLRNEEWQRRVTDFIAESRYVVIIGGSTEGLAWECRKLAELQGLGKVIVVFPPRSQQRLEVVWQTISAAISTRSYDLPAYALVARFGAGGEPRFVTSRWNDEDAYRLGIACSISLESFRFPRIRSSEFE